MEQHKLPPTVLGVIAGLVLGLSSVLIAGPAAGRQANVAAQNGFQWGEGVAGLQLGTALDETNGIIHCRVRNATTNALSCSKSDFGYFEFVHLELGDGTNWKATGFVLPGLHSAFGLLPYRPEPIYPGEIIDHMSSFRPHASHSHEEFLQMAHGDTNEARLTEQVNHWLATRESLLASLSRGDTFTLDLVQQTWPTNVFEQPSVKARVSQQFQPGQAEPGGTPILFSPVIEIKTALLQSYIAKGRKQFGK